MAYSTSTLSRTVDALSALAQESRLAVFRLLVRLGPEGMAAGEIAQRLEIPAATLSFHLKELSHAGLVSAHKKGRSIIYSADFAAMNDLMAFLSENCCQGDGESDAICGKIAAVPCPQEIPKGKKRS